MNHLLERIFSYQKNFCNDKVFTDLVDQLLELVNTLAIDKFRIVLGLCFLDDKEIKESEYVTFNSRDTKSYDVSVYIDSGEYSYIFEVSDTEINFSGQFTDEELLFNCETYFYQKKREFRKLTRTIEKIDQNDYYYFYGIDINSYDTKGNLTKKEYDEEDKIFSEKFGVPIDKARLYLLNFDEHKDYLNESKVKSEMEWEDNNSDNEYLFSDPFEMSDFALVFNFDYDVNEEHFYNAIGFGYTLEDLEVAKIRLNLLSEALSRQIGMDGELVFENNLFLNISNYVYNSSCEYLNTKGIIIKKVNGVFFVCFVEISNNQVTSVVKPLTKEEAVALYYKNEDNFESEKLKDFFEIERNRKG